MLVLVTRKPCTTSALVARNVMGVSVGTSRHCGVNEYCCATMRTVTEPSASTALPRLLSINSPLTLSVSGRIVSTREGGIIAQWRPVKITIATSTLTMITITVAHLRSMRAAMSSDDNLGSVLIAWFSLNGSLNDAAWQEDEKIEREPQADHDSRRRSRKC